MKIFCFIMDHPPLRYFVNRIHEHHPVDLAVVEGPRTFMSKLRSHGIPGSINLYRDLALNNREYRKSYERFYDGQWRSLNPAVPVMQVDTINADGVHELLAREKPDLVLVHGTTIIKNRIIDSCKMVLNLHWGLSPYYRGTHCTDWALINWDPYQIGVTIHKLSSKIDGGDIVAQKRAVIDERDTVHSINMQLTHLGVELIIDIISKMKNGERLNFVTQDFAQGFLTLMRQWNPHSQKQVDYIMREKKIRTMLDYPSRQKLPIVELA